MKDHDECLYEVTMVQTGVMEVRVMALSPEIARESAVGLVNSVHGNGWAVSVVTRVLNDANGNEIP